MLFDGKKFAAEKEERLRLKVAKLRQKGIIPKLVSILIGENPEGELYLKLKKRAAERVGIEFEEIKFEEKVKSDEVVGFIKSLNSNPKIQGIMVQMPIKMKNEKFQNDQGRILSAINPLKDVDCLTPENLGLLMMGRPRFLPATVRAVLEILNQALNKFPITNYQLLITKRWLAGKNACVVGASEIVGKPLVMLLSELGATVTICRSTTKDLSEFTKKADILVSATGMPGLIKKEMVKKGVVVIDVGTKRLKISDFKFKIVGDVESAVSEIASFLTPVPGGVGPVTVICLLENLVEAITF